MTTLATSACSTSPSAGARGWASCWSGRTPRWRASARPWWRSAAWPTARGRSTTCPPRRSGVAAVDAACATLGITDPTLIGADSRRRVPAAARGRRGDMRRHARAARPRLDRPRAPARRRRRRGHPAAAVGRASAPSSPRMFDDDALFRSTVVMARHAFGEGSYRYFAEPLPPLVQTLRTRLYPPIARVANALGASGWASRRSPTRSTACSTGAPRGPDQAHAARAALRPRRLQLPAPGRLRRPDVPAAVPRDAPRPDVDFTGGESVFVEQRPRQQSRPIVRAPRQGQAVVFPVHHRPRPAPAATTACRCATASAPCTAGAGTCWA